MLTYHQQHEDCCWPQCNCCNSHECSVSMIAGSATLGNLKSNTITGTLPQTHTQTPIHTHMHVCTCTCMPACVHTHTCKHTHLCAHACMHIHMHTHIHKDEGKFDNKTVNIPIYCDSYPVLYTIHHTWSDLCKATQKFKHHPRNAEDVPLVVELLYLP